MSNHLTGRRVEDPGDRFAAASEGRLKEGDYFKDAEGNWNICVPNCDPSCPVRITGNNPKCPNWTITEETDGTITVSPSILSKRVSGEGENAKMFERYHGYLVKDVWKSV